MKICVCTQYNTPFQGVADVTVPVLEEYCERHGYQLAVRVDPPIHRSVVWDRVKLIQDCMDGADWVAYFDTDVLITNLHIRLEEFMSGESIVMTEARTEDGREVINDGVCFFENLPYVRRTLDQIWDTPDSPTIFCAQDVIQKMSDDWDLKGILSIERQKSFNSFLYAEYGMPETTLGNWTPGDFALHLPGRTNERRVELFTEYSKHILR